IAEEALLESAGTMHRVAAAVVADDFRAGIDLGETLNVGVEQCRAATGIGLNDHGREAERAIRIESRQKPPGWSDDLVPATIVLTLESRRMAQEMPGVHMVAVDPAHRRRRARQEFQILFQRCAIPLPGGLFGADDGKKFGKLRPIELTRLAQVPGRILEE